MAIKNGIRTLLMGQSSITSLCAAQTIDNVSVPAIFVQTPRQGFKPAYVVISTDSVDARGDLAQTTGIKESDIEIECYAYTETKADALAAAVDSFFKDYSGAAGQLDTIKAVHHQGENDFENQEQNGQDLWRYAVVLSYTIFHE